MLIKNFFRKRHTCKWAGKLAGKMLISHPIIENEKYRKSLLFIESDDGKEISGVILNRPMHMMLKALGKNFDDLPVSDAPLYSGGPDRTSELMLTAWVVDKDAKLFEIYHSLDGEAATNIWETKKDAQFRAFLGNCQFDKKIFSDIDNGLWLVSSPERIFGMKEKEEKLWEKMLLKTSPNALLHVRDSE